MSITGKGFVCVSYKLEHSDKLCCISGLIRQSGRRVDNVFQKNTIEVADCKEVYAIT